MYSGEKREMLLAKLAKRTKRKIKKIPQTMVWERSEGEFLLSTGRLPCQQLYQRLMVAYDGGVYMCCNDWGAEHPIGFVAETGFED